MEFKNEFEKKYILRNIPQLMKWDEHLYIRQYYYYDDEEKVCRLRFTYKIDRGDSNLISTEIIHKEFICAGHNVEHHIAIDPDNADVYLKKSFKQIAKHRYVHNENGVKYEVDSFTTINLIVLEVEVPFKEYQVFLPAAFKKECIAEVTHLEGNPFSNFNLAY